MMNLELNNSSEYLKHENGNVQEYPFNILVNGYLYEAFSPIGLQAAHCQNQQMVLIYSVIDFKLLLVLHQR